MIIPQIQRFVIEKEVKDEDIARVLNARVLYFLRGEPNIFPKSYPAIKFIRERVYELAYEKAL